MDSAVVVKQKIHDEDAALAAAIMTMICTAPKP